MDDKRHNTPSITSKCAIQNVMCSAYFAKIGNNKILVVANSLTEALSKLENNGFVDCEIEDTKGWVALV
jgi:hypothetical protein